MPSERSTLGSRTLRIAHVALFLIGLSPSALAADFEVISSANTLDNGTFPWAIGQVKDAGEDENTISFGTILFEDLAVPTTAPLPAIELAEPTHSVELNATEATQFAIVRSGEAEDEFNILDIKKGKATVVDLKISGGNSSEWNKVSPSLVSQGFPKIRPLSAGRIPRVFFWRYLVNLQLPKL